MRNTKKIHPNLQAYIAFGLYECYKIGLHVRITETRRTIAEQDAFYAQGTSQVKGSNYGSMHQWGVAFDVCRNDGNGAYDFTNWIDKVSKIFKSYPLAWGGDWKGFVDQPHFQMKAYEDTYGGTSKLKASYANPEAFEKAWGASKITEQFANLNIADTKALLDKKFTTVKAKCNIWKGEKTLKKKDVVAKGTVVYIMQDFGNGRSQVLYLKGSTVCTGYIYNFQLQKSLSKFEEIKVTADKSLYGTKYNKNTAKVGVGSNTGVIIKKGTKVKSIQKDGKWLKIRVKVNGKYKLGWIEA